MAKHTRIGNCRRRNWNGRAVSVVVSDIRGKKTRWPMCDPLMISASMTCGRNPRHIIRVPLHKPPNAFRFRMSMTGQFSFSFSSCGGIPDKFSAFKNSVGYSAAARWSKTESALVYVCISPGNRSMTLLLMKSTSAFFGDNTARAANDWMSLKCGKTALRMLEFENGCVRSCRHAGVAPQRQMKQRRWRFCRVHEQRPEERLA